MLAKISPLVVLNYVWKPISLISKDEIYGETVEIIWLDKIRDMVKFAGADELIEQLKSDKEVAANWKKDSQVP